MFRRILIANRGEIACRVTRTAQRLGVQCVAVFSEADRHAQHVQLADMAVCVGGTASSDSYLRTDRVLEAALSTGAQAIHPGYGFLSENAAFADAVRAAGLTFIGPPAQAMRDMGAKDASKRLMEAAGVPLLPGYHGLNQDYETLERESLACGLATGHPVLLKAVLGGGGKGMRVVNSLEELSPAIESAKREAISSFGDDRLLVERYLPSARHIEVQVFCDQHGEGVYLFERDCSIQRRHQKVLEEAPAPGVDEALREELGKAAVRAAQAVDYEGAGTVEFIADASDPNHFFFMEMNTRLQVEHPVTEMVTGVDLVEWQLRVAAGERLPLRQSELTLAGHSFEARVYAERPEAGFLPGSGHLSHLRTPEAIGDTYVGAPTRSSAEGIAVRMDSGVVEGDEVSVFYDPMISKLIVRGPDRPAALQVLKSALASWETVGVPTNVAFMRRILDTQEFADADVHTAFIEQHKDVLLPPTPTPSAPLIKVAALGWLQTQADALAAAHPGSVWADYPFRRLGGGVCGGGGQTPLKLQPLDADGAPAGDPMFLTFRHAEDAALSSRADATSIGALELALGSEGSISEGEDAEWSSAALLQWDAPKRRFRASVDGASILGHAVVGTSDVDGPAGMAGAVVSVFTAAGEAASVLLQDTAQQAAQRLSVAAAGGAALLKAITAPMPGKIVRVLVEKGQAVSEGEPLVVMEAMKMEHTMKAPADAVVDAVHGVEGDVVGQRALLVSFKEESADA